MIDPYHSGERAIQEMTGERDKAILNGRNIAGALSPRAGGFLEQQQMCVLGWRSPAGDVWASILAGRQGFARARDDGGTLALWLDDDADSLSTSPPFAALKIGDPLGVLFLDPSTRRRLRQRPRGGPARTQLGDRNRSGLSELFEIHTAAHARARDWRRQGRAARDRDRGRSHPDATVMDRRSRHVLCRQRPSRRRG